MVAVINPALKRYWFSLLNGILSIRFRLIKCCFKEIEDVWKQIISFFFSFKDEGKLSAEL